MATLDPYAALGVPRTATREEIARAYRSAVKRSHPDTGALTSPAQMARITEAWRILGDPVRRARWDREHFPGIGASPWTAPVVQPAPNRPRAAKAPPSRMDSGWLVAVGVIGFTILLGGLMLSLSLAVGPPAQTRTFTSDEVTFDYPSAWTLTPAVDVDADATHRVIAHLTSFSTDTDERCIVFTIRCHWEERALPAGGASIQLFEYTDVPPPGPEPDRSLLIGGRPSARAQTTVGDEFLSAWWLLSPPDYPDRWIEVRAEIRGGELERGRRMAQIDAMLDSLEFTDGP